MQQQLATALESAMQQQAELEARKRQRALFDALAAAEMMASARVRGMEQVGRGERQGELEWGWRGGEGREWKEGQAPACTV